jgi:hypothetical protein
MRLFSRIWLASWTLACLAQSPTDRFAISGTVTDPSGAGAPGVKVTLQKTGGSAIRTTVTGVSGAFRFVAVTSGDFEVLAEREGFASEKILVRVTNRSPAPLRITLKLADVRQQVTVTDAANQVSTNAPENLDTVTLDRQMLDNLPIFDQDYVAAMSQFLDPGAIGTNGVTLIVDGVEQNSIGVSASQIQQVKINQNPYSAEFSRPGRGRIEVITKPGSQEYHGTFNFVFRDYHLNARDAFAEMRPPEQRRIFEGSLIGPLGTAARLRL